MNLLTRIVPEYSYNYFDKFDQLQTKKLNIFQCFFRKLFGCYAETHLSNVVNKAYTLTLDNQFDANYKKDQELLKLIAKAERVYGFQRSYVNLPNYNLLSGNKLNVSVRYNINKPEYTDGHRNISRVYFKLVIKDDKYFRRIYEIKIFKNMYKQVVVELPEELFLSPKDLKTVNDFVVKILNDSSNSRGIAEIRCCGNDYERMPYSFRKGLFINPPGPDELNRTQDEEMSELGWNFLEVEEFGFSRRRVYTIKKETAEKNQNLVELGFKQKLSIDFVNSHLECRSMW